MPADRPSRDLEKVLWRLPDGLRDKLKIAAKANGRTMNAEAVARLLASFSTEVLPGDPAINAELMAAMRIAAGEAIERLLTEPNYRKRLRSAAAPEE